MGGWRDVIKWMMANGGGGGGACEQDYYITVIGRSRLRHPVGLVPNTNKEGEAVKTMA